MKCDVPESQVQVIYNGGGFTAERWQAAQSSRVVTRAQMKIPPDAVVILYVGAFVPAKGVHHLAHSFAALSWDHPEAHLVLAGSEDLWKGSVLNSVQAEGYAAKLQKTLEAVQDRTHFLGLVASSKVAETYALADIVVIPSVCREAFGITALEGLSCGLPVIASASGGLAELVGDGRGLLVPPGDEPALTRALVQLIDDPVERKTLGDRGRAYARQPQFGWDQAAQQMIELYSDDSGRRK